MIDKKVRQEAVIKSGSWTVLYTQGSESVRLRYRRGVVYRTMSFDAETLGDLADSLKELLSEIESWPEVRS